MKNRFSSKFVNLNFYFREVSEQENTRMVDLLRLFLILETSVLFFHRLILITTELQNNIGQCFRNFLNHYELVLKLRTNTGKTNIEQVTMSSHTCSCYIASYVQDHLDYVRQILKSGKDSETQILKSSFFCWIIISSEILQHVEKDKKMGRFCQQFVTAEIEGKKRLEQFLEDIFTRNRVSRESVIGLIVIFTETKNKWFSMFQTDLPEIFASKGKNQSSVYELIETSERGCLEEPEKVIPSQLITNSNSLPDRKSCWMIEQH